MLQNSIPDFEKTCSAGRCSAVILIFLSIIIFVGGCVSFEKRTGELRASAGRMDLSGWDFEKQGIVTLSGEWGFYWTRFLHSQGPLDKQAPAAERYISVPSAWNGFDNGEGGASGHGFATYRLLVHLKPSSRKLALKIPDLFTSYNLYVNGKKMAQGGRPGQDPDSMIPGLAPQLVILDHVGENLVIDLEVSNFHHRLGGAIRAPEIGAAPLLLKDRTQSLLVSFTIFIVILMMGLYHIIIFFLRPSDRSPLFFGLFCLFVSTRPFLEGDRVVFEFLPNMDWTWLNRLIYLGLYWGIVSFVLFIRTLFPDDINKRYPRIFVFLAGALSLCVLVFPVSWFSHTMPLFELSALVTGVYLFFCLVTAYRRSREGALVFLSGFTILFLFTVNDLLFSQGFLNTGYITPIGVFLFLFVQAFFLARRFSRSFTVVETQSRRILETNQSLIREIGERRKVEEALRQSEEKYRILIENQTDMVVKVDIKGRLVFVSPSFCRFFGKTEQELLGESLLTLAPAEDKEQLNQLLGRLKTPPYALHFDQRAETMSGQRWLGWSAVGLVDESGRVVEITGVGRDISEKKNAEEKLETQYRLMNSLLENLPVGVIMVKAPDGEPLLANAKAYEILGVDVYQDVPLEKLSEHYKLYRAGTAELYPIEENPIMRGLMGERRRIDDMVRVAPGGKKIYFEVYGSSVKDDSGNVLASIVSFADVTERKLADEERGLLEEKLRQAAKMEAVGTLAGGVAHDFNNLLQVINGFIELLLVGKEPDDLDYQSLKEIAAAGDRAAGLVRQLLLFSRKAGSNFFSIDINQEMEDAGRILARTIPKMVELKIIKGQDLWLVNADSAQIQQVFLNLGNNAAQAMPDGGRLTMETRNAGPDDEIPESILDQSSGEYVVIEISDVGLGISQENLEHIFEPFFTTKGVGQGTGLGLASVYGIVKGHGGAITCESKEEFGTVFKIFLPAAVETAGGSGATPVEVAPGLGDETLLVVDDEPAVRDLAAHALKNAGYTVVAASSGEEALNLYSEKKHEIDLVILDIGMPGMGGLQCLRELIGINPTINVLVATGYAVKPDLRKLMDSCSAGVIAKPYRLNELLRSVREFLDKKATG